METQAGTNPYRAPDSRVEDLGSDNPQAESIRNEYLKHESAVRSIGVLNYIGTALLALATVAFVLLPASEMNMTKAETLGIAAILGVLTALGYLLGRGMRNLRRWAAIIVGGFAVLGLITGLVQLPKSAVGMVIDAYIAWAVFSTKGRYVTTPEYRAIVEATPHIKSGMSIVLWILIGISVLFVIALAIPLFVAMH